MERVTITPTAKASRRTKNRIREHGPEFEMEARISNSVFGISGSCRGFHAGDGWIGWLPENEFTIVDSAARREPINKIGSRRDETIIAPDGNEYPVRCRD